MEKTGQKGLSGFFEDFLNRKPLFLNKKALQSNYTPETIPHREEQVNQIAKILAPALRLDKPSNLFIYGQTGTGKTCVVKYLSNELMSVSKSKKIPLKICYVNCKLKKVADTEYRLIAQLSRDFGREIPATGLPTEEVYKVFFTAIDKEQQQVIIVLDEIDQLVKKAGDELLYNLTRANADFKNAQISIIGVSNDLVFADSLDPRVKSSLSEEEIVFPPYNALQIQDILRHRAKEAFAGNVLKQGVVEKCAAYAAREHGDARRALELLRVAGEIAERECAKEVTLKHIDDAEEKIEHDRILATIQTQPKQHQATLYSIIAVNSTKQKQIFTGEIYEKYKDACLRSGLRPLTQRRIGDIIAELDMLGIINAKIISKGRYGRTREISMAVPSSVLPQIEKILAEGLDLS